MAKRFVAFNLWQPASENWQYMAASYDETTRLRWTDTHTWGILRDNSYPAVVDIPVSAVNAAPPRWPNILAAPVSLDCSNGLVSVGAGSSSITDPKIAGAVAYDLYGNRIAVLDDAPFNFSNDSPYGKQSSGNLNISLNLSGTSGDCFTNPSIPGIYYLWAEYLEINDPTPVIAENGAIHYPMVDDGYKIIVTDTPIAPTGDGVSVFLAKITWIGGSGTLTATDGNVSDANNNAVETAPTTAGDPNRVWAGKRPQHVEIVVDEANKIPAYGLIEGKIVLTLHDHVNAMGGGLPTHNNPHALTLADIPGAGDEPVATLNQRDAFAKGLVDLNAPQNSPARLGDVAMCFSFNNALQPAGTLDPAANNAAISTSLQQAFVRILDFDTNSKTKAAFLLGLRLVQLYPTMNQTSSHNSVPAAPYSINDGWVGFELAPAGQTGVYRIYGTHATLADGTDVLLVNKQLLASDLTGPIPAPADDMIVLGQVYWDAVAGNLYKNPVQPPPVVAPGPEGMPDDQRSLGLVGPQQLSTELKSDPYTGGISQQVFENQAANSNYALGLTNVSEVQIGPGDILSSPSVALVGGDLATGGPAAVTGRKWTMNSGAALNTSYIFHLLKNAKPGKLYGLSFWAKATAAFNARMRLAITNDKVSSPTSLITLDGSFSVPPLDMTLRNDSQWHRYSIILQTLPTVNPDPTDLKYLCFQFDEGGVVPTAGSISLTNVQLTEGEWIPGYMGSKYVPSGGIIMWDYNGVCPAGFQEVAGLVNRFPVGVGNVAFGAGAGAFNPGAPPSHIHVIPVQPTTTEAIVVGVSPLGVPFGGGVGAPQLLATKHNHDFSGVTDPANEAVTPYYGVKFCRAI
jgi:hypothetical protein